MKKYGIIYADPPWAYRNKHCEGNALAHYNTILIVISNSRHSKSYGGAMGRESK